MASTRDKKRARALMRANPDLNYTAALRQVQASHDPRSAAATARPSEGSTLPLVIDPLHDLATPKDLIEAYPELNEHTALVDLRDTAPRPNAEVKATMAR